MMFLLKKELRSCTNLPKLRSYPTALNLSISNLISSDAECVSIASNTISFSDADDDYQVIFLKALITKIRQNKFDKLDSDMLIISYFK